MTFQKPTIKTTLGTPKFTRGGQQPEQRTAESFKAGLQGSPAVITPAMKPAPEAAKTPLQPAAETPTQALAPHADTPPALLADDPFPPAPPGTDLEGDFVGERMTKEWTNEDYLLPRLEPKGAPYNPEAHIKPGAKMVWVKALHWSWVHFNGDRVDERRPFIPGYPFEKREELEPPPPEDPREMDSWKLAAYAYGQEPGTFKDFTLYGSGGHFRGAVSELQKAITAMRRHYPAAMPLVRLDDAVVPGKGGKRGGHKPAFVILKWRLPDGREIQA
jgi:hypothetical protein